MAELAEIVGDEDQEEPPPAGVVPREWVGVRGVETQAEACIRGPGGPAARPNPTS